MKLAMYVVAPQPILTEYLIPPISLCLCLPAPLLGNIFPHQRLQKKKELLNAPFSLRYVSCEKFLRICLFFPISLIGKGSMNTFPRQRRMSGDVILYAIPVVSKKNRRVILSIACYCMLLHKYSRNQWPNWNVISWGDVLKNSLNKNCISLLWLTDLLTGGFSVYLALHCFRWQDNSSLIICLYNVAVPTTWTHEHVEEICRGIFLINVPVPT
jgi:hypothetical protein